MRPQPFHSRLLAVCLGELLNKGAVVVAFVWIARTLPPGVYGLVEWALSVTMAAFMVCDVGLSITATAAIAAHPDEVSTIIGRVAPLRLAVAIPAYLVVLAAAWLKGGTAGSALAIYGLILFVQCFFMQFVFDGLRQARWTALGNAVRGTAFLASVLLLVHAGSQPSAVAEAEVIAALAIAACHLIVVRRVFHLPIGFDASRDGLSSLFARTWRVAASDVTWGVQAYVGLILLGYMATPQDAAWHSSGLRLLLALHTGVWLYLTTLLPNLARLTHDPDGWTRVVQQSVRLTGWIGCGIALVGVLAASTILTTVFGPPFVAAVAPFRAMIWVIPVAWLSGHVRYALIAAGRPDYEYRAKLVGAATTIALTIALAPAMKSTGTAIALLGGSIANAIAAWVLMRGVLPRADYASSMAASSLCCLACLGIGFAATPALGEVPATIAVGALMAGVAIIAERQGIRDILQAMTGGADAAEAPVRSQAGLS